MVNPSCLHDVTARPNCTAKHFCQLMNELKPFFAPHPFSASHNNVRFVNTHFFAVSLTICNTFVRISSSCNSICSSTTRPVRDGSGGSAFITFGRTVAICGRYFLHKIVAIIFPPNAGRLANSNPVSSSISSIVVSAVNPVGKSVAMALAKSFPDGVAPYKMTSGLCLWQQSSKARMYGSVR